MARFERRGVSLVALSVDLPTDSLGMIERLGLSFPLGSDPEQRVVRAFGVQNPDTQELALHAVYIVDADGRVIYRKVARRRPVSAELIDAIDAHRGVYPQNDSAEPARPTNVAYPTNNYQALLEMVQAEAPPAAVDAGELAHVLEVIRTGHSDASLIRFKALVARYSDMEARELERLAAWFARQVFGRADMLEAGASLARRLSRVRTLERRLERVRGDGTGSADDPDALLHQLAQARGGLTMARAGVDKRAGEWRLRFAKTLIRSYREVALAAKRGADTNTRILPHE